MWGKTFAAILLGLPLAVALIGLAALLRSDQARHTLPWLLMFFPVWIGVMSIAFLFRSGARAWLWLGSACAGLRRALWLEAERPADRGGMKSSTLNRKS